nr:hypothetical protein [Tanacetum cinerariifolium]
MSRHKSETDIRVHIYSVKTGNWKRLGDCSHAGVYSNGALHWLAFESLRSSLPKGIVSLDLEKETYGKVFQLPKYEEGGKNDLTLGVLGEWFCVLCDHGSHADVWAMKDYGVQDSWTKLVSIPCHNHLGRHFISSPLCISNDGKSLLTNWLRWVVFDCINGACSEIQDFDGYLEACIVVESLASP